jgi:hypothetical protein
MSTVVSLRVFAWAMLGYISTSSEPAKARDCLVRAQTELGSAQLSRPDINMRMTVGFLSYIPAVLAAYEGDHTTALRGAKDALATEEANDYLTVVVISGTQLAAACQIVLGEPAKALETLSRLDQFDLTFFTGDDIRGLAYVSLGELDQARRFIRIHAERAAAGQISGQACDSALLLAALARAEGDAKTATELLLQMGIGLHAATRMFSTELAARLGVAGEHADRLRQALTYDLRSEQGPTGAHMAMTAVRQELARRGWG